MKNNSELLFISRAYPPIIGGIENQNQSIYQYISRYKKTKSFLNTKGKKMLPFFIPWVLFRSLFITKATITLLGDGVLTIIPWLIKKIKPENKYICVIHGLDATYPSKIYQKLWITLFFQSVDHFIAVSHNTKKILITKGVNADNITVIPNGFDFSSVRLNINQNKMSALIQQKTKNKTLLLTLGRLVKRKGVAWFVGNVVPQLPNSIIYVIAGSGPETGTVQQIIKTKKLSDKVILLGQVTELEKEILLSNSDLFIQPNIRVKNDVEGFGISVIEASAYNLPVIAANLEGLKDAIYNNKNGWLVKSGYQEEFIEKIIESTTNKKQLKIHANEFKLFSQSQFSWDIVIKDYIKVINLLQN